MELKDLLNFVWNIAFGISFTLAIGFLIRPKLGSIFKRNFSLGVWSLFMTITTVLWMLLYLSATFWELHIVDKAFERSFNPELGISHIILPIILGLGFAVLVAHSWKLHVVLPVAIAIGFADLIGNSIILEGISEMLIRAAHEGKISSDSAKVFQDYFFENSHLLRIVGYMVVLAVGSAFAILSLGERLFRSEEPKDMGDLAAAIERNKVLFDRLARGCFILAIWGNEAIIWSWRISRTNELSALGLPWWHGRLG